MELRHLRYFVAVAEHLNFTRAAEKLHMAQPPLSTQIRSLETELGAELFIREKRRVHLTQAGHELLGRARSILGSAGQAKVAVKNAADGVIGRVTLAYTASAMFSQRLPAVIRDFNARNRHVALTLVELASLDQIVALHDQKIDVGVLRKPDLEMPAGIVVEPWHTTPLIAAVPSGHSLAGRKAIRILDLRNQPIITYPRDAGIGLYWPFLSLCAKANFHPQIVREARESSVIVGLVAAGIGIAVVPSATQCIHLPGVVYVRIQGAEAQSTLYLGHRKNYESAHAYELLKSLRSKQMEGTRTDGW
jgi:DNA-binding transcriptional LysR family regulator